MMRFCMLLCFLSLLAGCAQQHPNAFEVPLSQWNNASETERQNLIEQYNVSKLSHYDTEPTITMAPAATPTQQPPLSILNEHQKAAEAALPPSTAPKKLETPKPPKQDSQQPPVENNWLQLNG